MITWPSLNSARLGNQLFGIAATLAHAEARLDSVRFPPWPRASSFSLPDAAFGELPKPSYSYSQPDLTHYPLPPRADPDMPAPVVALHGNFISWRFFAGHEAAVRRAFAHPTPLPRRPEVAIHVRRTDYIGGPYCDLGLSYYEAQMVQFHGASFLVFSYDIPYCERLFAHRRDVSFARGSDVADLHVMSTCAGHIIANSTFSWWGAWLADNDPDTVIAPRQYHTDAFRSRTPHVQKWEDEDLWPPGWRLADVPLAQRRG